MKGILVRVGIDQAYGGWNAPVDTLSGQFVFVPIPDAIGKTYPPGLARNYNEMDEPLAQFAQNRNLNNLQPPSALLRRKMHLDPDFDYLTYGDNGARRGAGVATLSDGDVIAFYAGLRSTHPPQNLVYALVGLFTVAEVLRASEIQRELRHENAHTRWEPISKDDIVVRGRPGASGRFDRCISVGEWRDGAYRVRRDVEEAWGGLSVKNGFIQRSAVPPEFKNAEKFLLWFRQQNVKLLGRNN